jgi:uncharacterized protein
MEFEWNQNKAELNFEKHDISFQEAATVFNDPLSLNFPDFDHSIGESRYVIIGISRFGQLRVVAHTERGENIRIISSRKATRQERKLRTKWKTNYVLSTTSLKWKGELEASMLSDIRQEQT